MTTEKNKFAKFTSNQPPVVYPEVTVVLSATSRSVVLMNGGVVFLVMRLFSFEHG